jgi:hypothetical protein
MNNDYGGNPGSRRAGLLAVVAVLATATACGGRAPSAGPGSEGPTGQMLAYSQCMRAHGVPDFPDPDAAGNIQLAPGNPDDPLNSSQEQVANETCRHLLPGGGASSSGTRADRPTASQLLKLAQCMRAHGVPSFPDPTGSGGSIALPTSLDFNSPQFKDAARACKPLIPAGLFPATN